MSLRGFCPVVGRVFAHDEVHAACRSYETGAAFGKVVIRVA